MSDEIKIHGLAETTDPDDDYEFQIDDPGLESYRMSYGNLKSLIFPSDYIKGGLLSANTTTATSIDYTACDAMIAGDFFSSSAGTATNSGIAASTAYGIWFSSTTGNIAISAAAWTGISGMQLNVYTALYDADKNYCYDATLGRLIGVAISNSGGTGYDYILPIRNVPYSFVVAKMATTQTIGTGSTTLIHFDSIVLDLNSEYSTSTWLYTSKLVQKINFYACITNLSVYTAYRKRLGVILYDSSGSILLGDGYSALHGWYAATGNAEQAKSVNGVGNIKATDYLDMRFYQNSGGDVDILASDNTKMIVVGGEA